MTKLFWVSILAACHPSASVENTMPIASMQSYRSVALRVHSSAFAAQGQAMQLEQSVLAQLHQKCSFEEYKGGNTNNADLVMDLNIVNAQRGGGGIISNSSTAHLDALLVLSEPGGDIVGTAKIRGESSGMIINNAAPEGEAIEVVAKTVADIFAKSGCQGPRIAKATPPPPPPPDPGSKAPVMDESKRPEADKLNEDGKNRMFNADLRGAVASFQGAVQLIHDPRYIYNLCNAQGALEQWDAAIATCKDGLNSQPNADLAVKLEHKVDLLQHHQ
ncbi:MAG: hypothetical protein QM831_35900 [Kofleriaceae bacterium]